MDLEPTVLRTDSPLVISVRNVSKAYRIYDQPQDRLKQMVWRGRRTFGRDFWALRDVSLQVRKGETVGIIGRNGSGKSTLLQMIAGTLTPTSGEIVVNGRVGALLELGSGFSPEFSGRENVYLNAAILGLARSEIDDKFEDIADFADIGDFIDQPVKHYSSGMLVRLAFAVHASIEPEILIVDEALSVGDMYFQAKCMARIGELRAKGTSILFVSHSLGAVKALSSRAILLEAGRMVMEGHPDAVGDRYVSLVMRPRVPSAVPESDTRPTRAPSTLSSPSSFDKRITERFGTGAAQYVDCRLYQGGREVANVLHGQPCELVAWLDFRQTVQDWGEVGVVIRTLDGIDLFAVNSFLLRQTFPPFPKGSTVRVTFKFQVILAPGVYTAALGYRVPAQGEYVDKAFTALTFSVDPADAVPIPFIFVVPAEFTYALVDRAVAADK